MSKAELDQLERDVELARQRVSEDVQRLQSPATLSDFKDGIRSEVSALRDEVVGKATAYRHDLADKATSAVKDRAQGFVAEVKERAAANPLAALAIGGGLLWRLFHKPPIATLLVGGGLFGLLKTDPQHPAMGAEFVPQAVDLAIAAKDKAVELTLDADDMVSAATTKGGEWATNAGDMVSAATTKAGEWATNASDALARAAIAAEPVKETLEHWGVDAEQAVSEFATIAKSLVEQGSERIQRIAQDPEERDKYLLGAAAVALISAVGIASQRRLGEHGPSEPDTF